MDKYLERVAEVILMEENRNFALDKSRKISGQITASISSDMNANRIVEFHLQGENLLPSDPNKYRYKLMLLGLDKGQSLHKIIGEVKANNRGQVEEVFHLNIDNVDGKGNSLTCFFIFMIVAIAAANRKEPFHPVLKGDWDNKWYDCKPGLKPEPDADPVQEANQTQKTYNGYYNTYVRQMTDDLVKHKDRFLKTVPFNETWIADNWRRVELVSSGTTNVLELFPVVSRTAKQQIDRYGHFIFAFNDEYFLLGIPGTHNEEDQPDQGESGFVLWQPIKDSDYYGYWLMMIQRTNGLITSI